MPRIKILPDGKMIVGRRPERLHSFEGAAVCFSSYGLTEDVWQEALTLLAQGSQAPIHACLEATHMLDGALIDDPLLEADLTPNELLTLLLDYAKQLCDTPPIYSSDAYPALPVHTDRSYEILELRHKITSHEETF